MKFTLTYTLEFKGSSKGTKIEQASLEHSIDEIIHEVGKSISEMFTNERETVVVTIKRIKTARSESSD